MSYNYRTFAFISYSHKDVAVAKWLHRRLEAFRLPTEIHNDIEKGCKYLRPVFRDKEDLNSGVLGDELRYHLQQSKYLIILCSKNSAQSKWVSSEAKAFVEMRRLDHIIPVIIPDGVTPERELFPEFLRDYFKTHPESELLGINLNDGSREKALIRVISCMLGVEFDSLWRRHIRRQRKQNALVAVGLVMLSALLYLFAVPLTVSVRIDPEPAELPHSDDIAVSINGGEYLATFASPEVKNIKLAGYNRFKDMRLKIQSQYFCEVDTVSPLGFGLRRDIQVELRRDDSFGRFAGYVSDELIYPISGAKVSVAGYESITDADGYFELCLPLELQRAEQPIEIAMAGYKTLCREDETPGGDLRFILRR